jgi:hypothetical protein
MLQTPAGCVMKAPRIYDGEVCFCVEECDKQIAIGIDASTAFTFGARAIDNRRLRGQLRARPGVDS